MPCVQSGQTSGLRTDQAVRELVKHPLFILGIGIKIVTALTITASAPTQWYVPFLAASVKATSLDPWGVWLKQFGDPIAFPYGYAMFLVLLPGAILTSLMDVGAISGYFATLLAADIGLLLIARRLTDASPSKILLCYWLSPVVFIATYVFGFNDVIPAVFLHGSLLALRRRKTRLSGFLLITACSAKLTILLVIPFIFVYVVRVKHLYLHRYKYGQGLLIALIVWIFPHILGSTAVWTMILSNPESPKLLGMALSLSPNINVYIVPVVYITLLYLASQIVRPNFDTFVNTMGISFIIVLLLSPTSFGWYVIALPALVNFQMGRGASNFILVAGFSAAYAVSTVATLSLSWSIFEDTLSNWDVNSELIRGATHTVVAAAGLVLATQVWQESVKRNYYYRLRRQPLSIGIAGDSGTGKDTLAQGLICLFGAPAVSHISGDDYHLWDRKGQMWNVLTHLNPLANDLQKFSRDVQALQDGRTVISRQYDHATGVFGRPVHVKPNDIIIVSGLHALYTPRLRHEYTVSIFLGMDEDIRTRLKVQRDAFDRGQSIEKIKNSILKRLPDNTRYIQTQQVHADLRMHLSSISDLSSNIIKQSLNPFLELRVGLPAYCDEAPLVRILLGLCGLHVVPVHSPGATHHELCISGLVHPDDLSLAARMLCPQMAEFLMDTPEWKDGLIGVMQLIALVSIASALERRLRS